MEEVIINIEESDEVVAITVEEDIEEVAITVLDGFSNTEVLGKILTGLEAHPTRTLPAAADTILYFCKKVLRYLSDLGSAAFTSSDDYDAAGTASKTASSQTFHRDMW